MKLSLRRTVAWVTAFITAGAILGAAAPAVSVTLPPGPSAQLRDTRVDNQKLTLTLNITGLPQGTAVDPASVHVKLAGHDAQAHVTVAGASGSADTDREAMLVLDTSGSMRGARLTAAKDAAVSYLQAVPPDVKIGLVTFSDQASLALAPTADRSQLRDALGRITAGGDTALYDAVVAATNALGMSKPGERRLLILSDGEDTVSRASLASAVSAVSSAHIGADAVGIDLSDNQRLVLGQLAAAGDGRLIPGEDVSGLKSAFLQAAQTFSQQLAVSVDLPDGLQGKLIDVVTTVNAAGRILTATAKLQMPAPSTSQAVQNPPSISSPARPPIFVLVLVFLGILAVALLLILRPGIRRATSTRLSQLEDYRWSDRVAVPAAGSAEPQPGAVARATLSLANAVLSRGQLRSRLATELDRAGIRRRPQEWVAFELLAALAGFTMLAFSTGSFLLGILIGAPLGWGVVHGLLKVKAMRRSAAFAEQLPDTLQLVASSLRAGFSLSQALDGVVREGGEPAATEYSRALAETRIGIELEDALDTVATRMRCTDLAWVVMAVRISRDVGGNLAEVLITTVHTMRARGQLKRQIRALSAEGRMSAYVLIGLPIVVSAFITMTNPAYLRPLYTQPAGFVMLAIAVGGMVIGTWWMSRVIKVKV